MSVVKTNGLHLGCTD